jgi:PAS domain S-box-containing protein
MLLDEIQQDVQVQAELIGTFIREPLLKYDYAKVEQFLVQWAEEKDDVIEMKAIMPNKFVLVHYRRNNPSSYFINLQKQVTYSGNELINLTMIIDYTEKEGIIRDLQKQLVAGSIVITILLGTALWFSLRKMALDPLERDIALRKNAEEMLQSARDQLEIRVRDRTKELKDLNKSLLTEIAQRTKTEEALRESENKFRSIVINAQPIIFMLDTKGIFILSEGKALSSLGLRPGEVVGKSALEMYRNYPDVVRGIKEALSGKVINEIVEVEGSIYDVFYSPHRNSHGEIIGTIGMAVDITERKKAEQKLQESKERFRKIFQTAPVSLWEEDLSVIKERIDSLKADGVGDFRKYIDSHPELLMELAGKLVVLDVNEVTLKMYGADDREHLINSLDKVFVPESFDAFKEAIIAIAEGVKNFEIEAVNGTLDGRLINILISIIIPSELSEYNKVLVCIVDITERKKTEETLAEREQYLNTIIETEPECVKVLAPDGTLLAMNPAGLAMIEADSLEQVAGQQIYSLVSPANRDAFRQVTENVARGNKRNIEFEITGLKGTRKWLDTHAVPLRNARNEIIGVLGVTRDITEHKKADDALQKSEGKYSSLIAHIPDVAWISDVYGNTSFISPNVEAVYGYTPEEIYEAGDRLWFGRIHPEDVADVRGAYESLFKEETPLAVEYRIRRKDGEWIWLSDRSTGTYEKDGTMYADGVFSDITYRKRTEEALRLSEEKFSKAFRSSPTFITISTIEDGTYIDVNDAFMKASGFSREELVGHSSMGLGVWVNPDERTKLIKQLQAFGSVHNFETELRMKGGNILTVLYSAELIDIEGEQCLLAVKLDISDRKRLESQLLHAQKLEAVGQLAGGVAHDFNNILTAIISNSYMLKNRTREDNESRELVNKVIALSNNAAKVVQELLVFSRKQKTEMSLLHLNDVLKGVGGLLVDFIGRDSKIEARFANKELTIMADKNQLEQVIINLATNARDAMPDGGTLTIETDLVKIDEHFINKHGSGKPGMYVLLSVTDSGTGMDRATKEKIFEPFFTTKEVGKGTGLGLSIIYGIVQQHKGFLTVSSELGKGTTFYIYFPRAEAHISA